MEKIYDRWKKRWKDADNKEQITVLGKMMFKSKVKVLVEVFKTLKPEIDSVIEVGCGLGYTMEVFKMLDINCYGIDIADDAVNYCKKLGLNVEKKKLEDIKTKFDLVSSDGMLEHFLNFEPYVKKMIEISNRYVLLIQPNHDSFCGKTLVYIAEFLRSSTNVFEYNYRMSDFISVFEKYNFKIKQNIPIFSDVFRLLLFEKVK